MYQPFFWQVFLSSSGVAIASINCRRLCEDLRLWTCEICLGAGPYLLPGSLEWYKSESENLPSRFSEFVSIAVLQWHNTGESTFMHLCFCFLVILEHGISVILRYCGLQKCAKQHGACWYAIFLGDVMPGSRTTRHDTPFSSYIAMNCHVCRNNEKPFSGGIALQFSVNFVDVLFCFFSKGPASF